MSTDDIAKTIVPIITGLVSGLVVAVFNYFITKRKTDAETDKLQAEAVKIKEETVKIKAETQKLLNEMSSLSSTVKEMSYKLGELKEKIIYDGRSSCNGSHFKSSGERFFGESSDKPKAIGSLRVENGILNIQRANVDGRFRVTLLSYNYSGDLKEYLPKNDLISGRRQLKVSCEAKAINGSHTLLFIIKDMPGDQLDKHEEIVSDNEWTKIEAYFRFKPNKDCQLWIDDQNVSRNNSSVQLRNIVVTELIS